MQKDQKLTPKYWVFHDLNSDDIFPSTLSKSLENSRALARIHKHVAYKEWLAGTGNYSFVLVEIRLDESEELSQ